MVPRQVAQQVAMTDRHGQWQKPVAGYDVLNRVPELELTDALFDSDLPRADRAYAYEIGPPHRTDCNGPKLLEVPPDQGVRVEQQPHSNSPLNSRKISGGSGASKSSAIQPRPFPNPYLRRWRVSFGASGTSRALGLPDLAMMISRPWAACST